MDTSFTTIISAVSAVFGIIAVGFALRRINWLTEEADQSLLKLVVRVLVPCLIFHTVAGNEAMRETRNIIVPPIIGFAHVLLGMMLGLGVARVFGKWLRLDTPAKQRTFAVCIGIFNFGYIPIPLAHVLFPEQTVGVLFVHNMGVELSLWTAAVIMLTGGLGRGWYKCVLNGPLIAIVIALIFNKSGLHIRLQTGDTEPIYKSILHMVTMLGDCAIPVGLVMVGATAADYWQDAAISKSVAMCSAAVLLCLGVMPALVLLAARYAPVSLEMQRVLVLDAAMPSAVFPIILARLYGGDPPTAVRIALCTNIAALFTIPLWLRFGMHFTGL